MTVDQLQDSLAEHKIKIGMMARGLYSMLAQMIGESERIVIAAEGFASGNRAPIIVTDSYVYVASYATMMGGPQFAMIARSDVSGVEVRAGLIGSVVIHAKGTSYPVDRIPGPIAVQIAGALK